MLKKSNLSIAGLFTAAFDTGIEWLIFKGIAGFAGGNESSTLPWQRFASVMAASVVFKFLSHVFSYWSYYEGDDINKDFQHNKSGLVQLLRERK